MNRGNNNDGGDTRESEAMRKLFVGGICRQNTNEDTLKNCFGQYGEIVDHVVMRNGGESRGFAFVTYAQSESVEKVFQSRPIKLDGKEVDCKRAIPREFNTYSAHAKTTRLYVKGVKGVTPEELQEYIEGRHSTDYGTCKSIEFLKDPEGNNKGFGFIECSSSDFADRLVVCEQEFSLPNSRSVSIQKAEPKDGGSGGSARGGSRGSRGGRGGPRGGSRGGYNNNRGGGGGFNQYSGNQSGYGGNQGGYNNSQGGGYGNVAYPGQQSGGFNQGYQQQAGGYNSGGYGQQTGGYCQQSNSYNQQYGGYGQY